MEIKIGMEVNAEKRNLARERVTLEMPGRGGEERCLLLVSVYLVLSLVSHQIALPPVKKVRIISIKDKIIFLPQGILSGPAVSPWRDWRVPGAGWARRSGRDTGGWGGLPGLSFVEMLMFG